MEKIVFFICKGKFKDKYVEDKKYRKVREHCHYTLSLYKIIIFMLFADTLITALFITYFIFVRHI